MKLVQPDGQEIDTSKLSPRQRRRAAHAAAYMADFDAALTGRIKALTDQCRSRVGLPSRISLHGPNSKPVDERLNRFVEFVLQELAVFQVFQGKTFAGLLDILQEGVLPDGELDDCQEEQGRETERRDEQAETGSSHAGGIAVKPARASDKPDA